MLYECITTALGEEKPPTDIIHEPKIAKYVEDWDRKGDNDLMT